MEFNLDFLKEKGEALKNFITKKDDDDEKEEKSSVEKLLDFQKAKEEAVITESQKDVINTDDTGETQKIEEILKKESQEKEEDTKEKDLEDKLADIEKVISAFSNQTNLSSKSGSPFVSSSNINKAYDFQKDFTKELVQPYIESPSTSNKDRIELLISSLKKQNLI